MAFVGSSWVWSQSAREADIHAQQHSYIMNHAHIVSISLSSLREEVQVLPSIGVWGPQATRFWRSFPETVDALLKQALACLRRMQGVATLFCRAVESVQAIVPPSFRTTPGSIL